MSRLTPRHGKTDLVIRGASFALLLPLLFACARPLDEKECGRLLDHYTELLVREEDPAVTPEHVAEKVQEAHGLAASEPRFEMGLCPRKVARKSYECAMNAPSVDAVERCLIF